MSSIETQPNRNPQLTPALSPEVFEESGKVIGKGVTLLTDEVLKVSQSDRSKPAAPRMGIDQAITIDAPDPAVAKNFQDKLLMLTLMVQALEQLVNHIQKDILDGRLSEMKKANKEKLERLQEQLKKIDEAATKAQEAQKKAAKTEMICLWAGAATAFGMGVLALAGSAACAFLAVKCAAAVPGTAGLAAVPGVAGAIFFGTASALLATGAVASFAGAAVSATLAADATIRYASADHQSGGFLTAKQKKDLEIATYVLGGVSVVCSIAAGIATLAAGVLKAIAAALKAAVQTALRIAANGLKQTVKEILKQALDILKKTVMNAVKEALKGIQMALKNPAKAAFTSSSKAAQAACKSFLSVKTLMKFLGFGQAANAFIGSANLVQSGVSKYEIGKLMMEIANAKLEADVIEALIKHLEAVVQTMKRMIAELEKQIEETADFFAEFYAIFTNALNEQQSSVQGLHQLQAH